MSNVARLRNFVGALTAMADEADPGDESHFIEAGRALLQDLIRIDDWLPARFAAANPARYQQYLLHCDPAQRFSVVSFVWDEAQTTPVHDHTVWGLIGVLRGAEMSTRYTRRNGGDVLEEGATERLEPGHVDVVSPSRGDIHRVSNAFVDRVSVSIHVYGANIGAVRRATFDLAAGSGASSSPAIQAT